MSDSIEYIFEEIRVLGEGLLASGKAILEGDDDYQGEFFVSEIHLDHGPVIRRGILKMPPSLERYLFQYLAREIECRSDAQMDWRDHEEGLSEPDYDHVRAENRIYSSLEAAE